MKGSRMCISKILKILGLTIAGVIVLPIVIGLSLRAVSGDVPAPGRLLDVGGFNMHLNCKGQKNNDQPTVIIATGLGVSSPRYHWLVESLSSTVHVCVYDRTGMGWSERSNEPYRTDQISQNLHILLRNAGLKAPYVLAGHSYGGLVIRAYAKKYPDEVAGLAFLDSSHPDQTKVMDIDVAKLMTRPTKLLEILTVLGLTQLYYGGPPIPADFPANIITQETYLRQSSNIPAAMLDELEHFKEISAFVKLSDSFGDMPIVVITAGSAPAFPTEAEIRKFETAWLGLQRKMANLSTNSRQVTVRDAEHMSLVTSNKYARQVAEEIRTLVVQSQNNPN